MLCGTCLLALVLTSNAYTQDLHFSQFSHAPLLLSPTETGNYFGDWRLVNNYRRQWGQIGKPLMTAAIAYDRQIYIFNQKLSIGGQFVHDESGDYLLVHQKYLLSAAWHQTIGYHTFRMGIQGGMVLKRLNSGGFSFPDQFDNNTGVFNRDLPTGDAGFGRQIRYPDLNIGFAYSRPVYKLKPELTVAFFHINHPNESFLGNENRLPIREVVFLRAPITLNARWVLDPQLLYMSMHKSRDLVLGSLFNYNLGKNAMHARYAFTGISLRDGITRNWDAFIFTFGMQFRKVRTALSYDVTVSKLRLANSYQGALEFSLIYTGISSVLNHRAIPCERL